MRLCGFHVHFVVLDSFKQINKLFLNRYVFKIYFRKISYIRTLIYGSEFLSYLEFLL